VRKRMLSEEEFEKKLFKGMVKVAKTYLKAMEDKEDIEDIAHAIASEIKTDRDFYVLAMGIFWGLLADSRFAHAFLHNLNMIANKLREGVNEEEIMKEYEREWKLAKLDDFMVYGG